MRSFFHSRTLPTEQPAIATELLSTVQVYSQAFVRAVIRVKSGIDLLTFDPRLIKQR
jgi:hypothetical protein